MSRASLLALLLGLTMVASACASGNAPPGTDVSDAAASNAPTDESTSDGAQQDSGQETKNKKKKKATQAAKTKNEGQADGTSDSSTSGSEQEESDSSAAAASPVEPGTYLYDTDGTLEFNGNSRPIPKTTSLEARGSTGGVQTQVRDLRDSDGNGMVTETRLVYESQGVSLAYVKVTASVPGGITDVREFKLDPPELLAPTGAGPGFNRNFTMSGSGTDAKVTVETLRRGTRSVGGQTAKALLVRVSTVFSGAIEGYQISKTWYWTRNLLPLQESVNSDFRNGPFRVRNNYDATLKSS